LEAELVLAGLPPVAEIVEVDELAAGVFEAWERGLPPKGDGVTHFFE
jgi:hypothetical protein